MTVYYTYTTAPIVCRLVSVSDISGTYSNGAGGYGSTLTGSVNGALSLDSVAVAQNDFVLLTNQTDPTQNGPYKVTNTGDVDSPYLLTRAEFFLTPVVATVGTFLPVSAGSTNAGSIWMLVEPQPVTIGSDPINFVKT